MGHATSLVTPFSSDRVKIYDVIVPFSPGGPSDIFWRSIEPKINENLQKHNILLKIKNVPGAGGSIGLNELLDSQKLTFGFFSSFFAINKHVRPESKYNPDDVNFIEFFGYNKMIVISSKHKNLRDLQKYCATGNEVFYGSSGTGSTSELSGYYFAKKYLGCSKVTIIPYKTTTLSYSDLKAQRIDFVVDFSITATEHADSSFFNKIYEFTEKDLNPWHIFVSNKNNNPDLDLIKEAFRNAKADKAFTNTIETKFHVTKLADNKDKNWLEREFDQFNTTIQLLKNNR